jgi:hypothetical protein
MTLRQPCLKIGQEFKHPETGHLWRVTDIGSRTFLAIDITQGLEDHGNDSSWLKGPPYAVAEYVWDEHDIKALEDVPDIEWDGSPDPPGSSSEMRPGKVYTREEARALTRGRGGRTGEG